MSFRLATHLHILRVQRLQRARFQNAAPLGIAPLRMRQGRCTGCSQALLEVPPAETALAVLCLKHAWTQL